jgi:hypothetical protein
MVYQIYYCVTTVTKTFVTVWRVLRKCLHLKVYRLSIVQHQHSFLKHCALPVEVTLNRNYLR